MAQSRTVPPAPTAAGFANLLSSLMAPAAAAKAEPEWDDDGLAEDVATLSYESALRSHARYSSKGHREKPQAEERLQQAAADIGTIRCKMGAAKAAPAKEPAARMPQVPLSTYELSDEEFEPEPQVVARPRTAPQPAQRGKVTPFERNLKKSSITIRMSEEECEQLHQRAAEAGVTVSAYLRSCTFEAEALRSQVREVLSQLTASAEEKQAIDPGSKKPVSSVSAQGEASASTVTGFGWLRKLIPQGKSHQPALRA